MRLLVKIGGAQLEEAGARSELAQALAQAALAGHELVVVHGGGNQIRALGKRLGLLERYEAGLRVTDAATAPVVLMVLAGEVNRWLVASLGAAGLKAVGLCGADGALFSAHKLARPNCDLGYVGEVAEVQPELCELLLARGYTPVIASVAPLAATAPGPRDHFYNINADQAAAPLARALAVDALLFLTDVPGVLDARGAVLRRLAPPAVAHLRETGVLRAGMIPKVEAAQAAAAALPAGLVKIAPAQGIDAVLAALADDCGTTFTMREQSHHG